MNPKKLPLFPKGTLKKLVFSSLLELGPVIIFLVSSNYMRIYESIILLMIMTIISTVTTYHLQKRIPYLALYVALITIVFGSMTIHFHDVKFIQMRDTLYDATCALTLILGIMINVPFLKLAFERILPMTMRGWNKLTHLWIGFFILTAIGNEIVRRLFSLSEWFEYKGWIIIATSVFGLVSLYLSYEAIGKEKE